ncbi:glycosyltransferase family 9 protein [Dyadobacter sp. CY326]|uniref:glycosyltransferase family 9 protein n=1 Tax=Dyadobacter sp. CY326 TaxID=2907300 RepID=UPI001F3293D1|nr:glycosyltransferase family 9 protein [Dyadobacter sp. CY326]MCE7064924.1 glycosyltransferase family 9 protein [Dyadobacter sp. CY326]
MSEPSGYKNILCIRADNMGDVIMASPAMRALKNTFHSNITLLTSKAGAIIAPYLDCVDELMICNLPWVQSTGSQSGELLLLAEEIRQRKFDAVIIFTVYSQSSLPAAMLAYMADIPVRVAYARENPYQLSTHWIPDPEPYDTIRHQVTRDLALVEHLGARISDQQFHLKSNNAEQKSCQKLLNDLGISLNKPYIMLHPGVSELKREYPADQWIEIGKAIIQKYNVPILVSGATSEHELAEMIANGIGTGALSVAGRFSIGEFIFLLKNAQALISVNTGTIHIAAATQTPQVVLYAQTNPQHTPWNSPHRIIEYSVPKSLRSKNAIIRHVTEKLYAEEIAFPAPAEVLMALDSLLEEARR